MGIASIVVIILGGLLIVAGLIIIISGIGIGVSDIIRKGEIAKGIGKIVFDLVYGFLAIYGGFAAILSFM